MIIQHHWTRFSNLRDLTSLMTVASCKSSLTKIHALLSKSGIITTCSSMMSSALAAGHTADKTAVRQYFNREAMTLPVCFAVTFLL